MNLSEAKNNVFKTSDEIIFPTNTIIKGNPGQENFLNLGFQASNLGKAVEIFRKAKKDNANIALAFTSNAITCGIREYLASFILKEKVTMVITSAGAIEEDIIKSIDSFYNISEKSDDVFLREKGINRSYNIAAPNNHYSKFENFVTEFIEIRKLKGKKFAMSTFCEYAGEQIKNNNSFLRACYLEKIPVYVQGALDGSLGDILFFCSKNYKIEIDTSSDYFDSCNQAIEEADKKKLLLILGGSIPKHYCCNIHLLANGADYAIYLNTELVQDGGNAGACPNEAKSWGKLKTNSLSTKVFCDFSISFPLFYHLIYKEFL